MDENGFLKEWVNYVEFLTNKIKSLILLMIVLLLYLPELTYGAITLPWSSTLNCAEWEQGNSLSCDGWETGGGWSSSCSAPKNHTFITSNANNPSGGGGIGLRHYIGDGSNNHSGTLALTFASPQSELYIRWYFKYQLGFQWNSLTYHKQIYMWTATTANVPEPQWSYDYAIGYASRDNEDQIRWYNQAWDAWMVTGATADYPSPTKKSDGGWHWIELHLKMDTQSSPYNGIAEYWYDGIKATPSFTDVNFSGGNASARLGWTDIEWPSNQASPANGDCYYYDTDDIAIRTTGPIGPLGSGSTYNESVGFSTKGFYSQRLRGAGMGASVQ